MICLIMPTWHGVGSAEAHQTGRLIPYFALAVQAAGCETNAMTTSAPPAAVVEALAVHLAARPGHRIIDEVKAHAYFVARAKHILAHPNDLLAARFLGVGSVPLPARDLVLA
jgi:hypothetical protein